MKADILLLYNIVTSETANLQEITHGMYNINDIKCLMSREGGRERGEVMATMCCTVCKYTNDT